VFASVVPFVLFSSTNDENHIQVHFTVTNDQHFIHPDLFGMDCEQHVPSNETNPPSPARLCPPAPPADGAVFVSVVPFVLLSEINHENHIQIQSHDNERSEIDRVFQIL
jgi:hypothetical protein